MCWLRGHRGRHTWAPPASGQRRLCAVHRGCGASSLFVLRPFAHEPVLEWEPGQETVLSSRERRQAAPGPRMDRRAPRAARRRAQRGEGGADMLRTRASRLPRPPVAGQLQRRPGRASRGRGGLRLRGPWAAVTWAVRGGPCASPCGSSFLLCVGLANAHSEGPEGLGHSAVWSSGTGAGVRGPGVAERHGTAQSRRRGTGPGRAASLCPRAEAAALRPDARLLLPVRRPSWCSAVGPATRPLIRPSTLRGKCFPR